MSNTAEKINNSSWTDWSLNKLEIDYDRVLITMSNDTEIIVTICCNHFIGLSFIGHWDESVIEGITVETKGNLIDESLYTVKNLYGENPLLGGGVKKIDDNWNQLNIKLIDGNVIKIACKSIEGLED